MCYDSNYQHEITYDFLCYLVSRGQAFALSFSVLITGNDGQVKRLGIHQPDVPYRFAVCVCVCLIILFLLLYYAFLLQT